MAQTASENEENRMTRLDMEHAAGLTWKKG